MYREISKLIMYGDMDKDCILYSSVRSSVTMKIRQRIRRS